MSELLLVFSMMYTHNEFSCAHICENVKYTRVQEHRSTDMTPAPASEVSYRQDTEYTNRPDS